MHASYEQINPSEEENAEIAEDEGITEGEPGLGQRSSIL
jgi:hypothetical protein